MTKPAARITDMHLCPMVTPGLPPIPHVGGPVTVGCPTVLIGGMPAARVGDLTTCVGPPDTIAMGSFTVLIGGMPAARIGDMTAHGGSIVMGCPTVLIGDAAGGGGGGGGGAGGGGGGSGAGGSQRSVPPAAAAAYQSGVGASIGAAPTSQSGPLQPKEEKKEKTWIGIELKDFEDRPMPNHNFQVTLEGGQILRGCTDSKGYARFEGINPDQGDVAFTQLTETKDPDTPGGGQDETPAEARTMDYDAMTFPQPDSEVFDAQAEMNDDVFDEIIEDEESRV